LNNLKVTCYSGRSYADRPASFVWQGVKYEVKEVEREWLEPGEIWNFEALVRNETTHYDIWLEYSEERW